MFGVALEFVSGERVLVGGNDHSHAREDEEGKRQGQVGSEVHVWDEGCSV